jgi:hypothetical protein
VKKKAQKKAQSFFSKFAGRAVFLHSFPPNSHPKTTMPPSPDNTPEAVEAPLLARHLLAPRGGLNRRQRMLACIALSLAALTIGFAITAALIQVKHGWQSGPGGRKGSAVALADGGTTLLVWSGRAKHATADLDPRVVHELDVGTGRWRAMW